MAQLPGILPHAPLSISYETFTETATRFLTAKDAKILSLLSLEPPRNTQTTGSSLVDSWFVFERSLRLVLERIRSAKFKREYQWSAKEEESLLYFPDIQQIGKTASSFESPLEAERYINQARFACLDRLRSNHFFDSDAVFAYGLMLLLHERSDKFTAEAGLASYTTIYNHILGDNE
ncbi:MAG TPA: hypothetical protein VJ861_00520 [Treponemataceae bacterium]|nr:hypothetical protein [Treponemataceae bacterium]